jgi:hypothetical protein
MMPALCMQVARMCAPRHILQFHIPPGLSMVPAEAADAPLWRPPPTEAIGR